MNEATDAATHPAARHGAASRPAPLLIIGLDGASFNVLDPLMAAGHLPHLADIAASGLRTELLSTLPPATLPAWTSFLTASSPSVHGITDLWLRQPHTTELTPAQGSWRCVPTWLSMLAAQGLQVASLGMPGTYPPEPTPGLCIAGFDAPGASFATAKSVWPPSFYPTLKAWGGWRYATFNEYRRHPDRQSRAVAALLHDIQAKETVALRVQAMRPWDVLVVHLQASDTAGHHLWHTWDVASPRHRPTDGPLADALPAIYRRLDTCIGRLRTQAGPHCRMMVVSDHGMGGADIVAVHLNRALQELGLLQFAPPVARGLRRRVGRVLQGVAQRLPPQALGQVVAHTPPQWLGSLVGLTRGLSVNWAQTQAFSFELDYAPTVWLHRQGAFAEGTVTPEQAPTLRAQITTALMQLKHPTSHRPLVAAVHRRQDLGRGPHKQRFADLLIEPAWPGGYRPSFLLSEGPGPVVRTLRPEQWAAPKGAGMPGVHRRAGILLACGPNLPATTMPVLHMPQAGALVYSLMGQPLPAYADGQLPDVWSQFLASTGCSVPHSGAYWTQAGDAPADPVYSKAQTAGLIGRLQALGYMD